MSLDKILEMKAAAFDGVHGAYELMEARVRADAELIQLVTMWASLYTAASLMAIDHKGKEHGDRAMELANNALTLLKQVNSRGYLERQLPDDMQIWFEQIIRELEGI